MNQKFELFRPETEAAIAEPARSHLLEVGLQLGRFLTDNGDQESVCLADVSRRGSLGKFMSREFDLIFDEQGQKIGEREKTPLAEPGIVDEHYEHVPVIMALAHEGGDVAELMNSKCGMSGIDPVSLTTLWGSMSPQQFISWAGLTPGKKTTQMYADYCSWMLTNQWHTWGQYNLDFWTSSSERSKIWIRALASLAGESNEIHARYDFKDELSYREFHTKDPAIHSESDYASYIQRFHLDHCKLSSIEILDTLFFTEAYVLLEQTQDTALAIRVITARANFWAKHLNTYAPAHDDVVEQLVACATFAHPEHFKRAGFGMRNLLGLPTHASFDTTRHILAGPFAYFCQPRYNQQSEFGVMAGFERVLAYAQELAPGFTLEALLGHSGISHPMTIPVLRLSGCHVPMVDVVLAESTPVTEDLKKLLKAVQEDMPYANYQPESLVKLLAHKFDELSPGADGKPFDPKSSSNSSIDLDQHNIFRPAMKALPGLKSALIDHLSNLPSVTQDHLRLAGIEAFEAPQVVRKMSLSDQGKTFSSDLGL